MPPPAIPRLSSIDSPFRIAVHELSEVVEAFEVDGLDDWCFVVDYGSESTVVISGVSGFEVHMAVVDPLALTGATIDWWTNLATLGVTNPTVGDIWHIFQEGVSGQLWHWISCAHGTDNREALTLYKIEQIAETFSLEEEIFVVVEGSHGVDVGETNDHWLVPLFGGIAIGQQSDGGSGSYWHHISRRGVVKSGSVIDSFRHSNGASALLVAEAPTVAADLSITPSEVKIHVFAPSTLDATTASDLRWIVVGKDLDNADMDGSKILLSESGHNLAMPTVVRFANENFLVTYRKFAIRTDNTDDSGDIERQMFDSSGVELWTAPEVVYAGSANRPHTMRWGDYLITCWTQDTSTCRMQVEEIS